MLQATVGGESADASTVPVGHPQVVIRIHRHAVRHSPVFWKLYEGTTLAQRSVGAHGKSEHGSSSTVGVKQITFVAAERGSIGDHIAAVETRDGPVCIEAVEAA